METGVKSRWPVWLFIAVLLVANFWYDFHHPLGMLFDAVLGVVLLILYLVKN